MVSGTLAMHFWSVAQQLASLLLILFILLMRAIALFFGLTPVLVISISELRGAYLTYVRASQGESPKQAASHARPLRPTGQESHATVASSVYTNDASQLQQRVTTNAP